MVVIAVICMGDGAGLDGGRFHRFFLSYTNLQMLGEFTCWRGGGGLTCTVQSCNKNRRYLDPMAVSTFRPILE